MASNNQIRQDIITSFRRKLAEEAGISYKDTKRVVKIERVTLGHTKHLFINLDGMSVCLLAKKVGHSGNWVFIHDFRLFL